MDFQTPKNHPRHLVVPAAPKKSKNSKMFLIIKSDPFDNVIVGIFTNKQEFLDFRLDEESDSADEDNLYHFYLQQVESNQLVDIDLNKPMDSEHFVGKTIQELQSNFLDGRTAYNLAQNEQREVAETDV